MKAVKVKTYEDILRRCFASDPELVSKYHIAAGGTVEDCVQKTMYDLKFADPSFTFFKIMDGKNFAGFFGTETINGVKGLTTFFIHPKYRKKEKITRVWNIINQEFQYRPFITCIYSKNTRAANFFIKNGGQLIAKPIVNRKPGFLFLFNAERNLCQL